LTLIRSRPHGKGILGRNKTGPVLYLGDTQKSASQWSDISGRGNHGLVYGAGTPPAATPGALGYLFDGVDDYVNCRNATSLRMESGSFTVESWIKPSANIAVNERYTVAAFYIPGWSVDLVDDEGSEGYRFYSGNTIYKYTPPSGLISLNWTHFVVVRDISLSEVHIYLNGVLKQTFDVTTVVTSTNPLLIGKRTSGGFFNGSIDEVRIFNRALSATEIKRLYERTRILFGV